MLLKVTLGVNFINILQVHFLYISASSSLSIVHFGFVIFLVKGYWQKKSSQSVDEIDSGYRPRQNFACLRHIVLSKKFISHIL